VLFAFGVLTAPGVLTFGILGLTPGVIAAGEEAGGNSINNPGFLLALPPGVTNGELAPGEFCIALSNTLCGISIANPGFLLCAVALDRPPAASYPDRVSRSQAVDVWLELLPCLCIWADPAVCNDRGIDLVLCIAPASAIPDAGIPVPK
jgi:hypothetical protein